jgi:tetratricopeptide (TPR) repeat protein
LSDTKAMDETRDKSWESLYSTWELSFNRVQMTNPVAAEVLALISFLHPDKISVSLLAHAFSDKLAFSEAIALLRTTSLIRYLSDGKDYSVHRLVQAANLAWIEAQGSRPYFHSMAIDLLVRAFPDIQYDNWEYCSTLLPHAIRVLSFDGLPERDRSARGELLDKVSQYQLNRGNLLRTYEFAREAFEIMSGIYGRASNTTARCQYHLAKVLLALGSYQEAKKLAVEAFENLQEQDPNSPDAINAIGLMGLIMQKERLYSEAKEVHERS